MTVKPMPPGVLATGAPIVIVGAGAAGFCAALSAHEAGVDVVVLERDSVPRGSTALSAGLIPAAATRFQKALGIVDSPALFAADIQRKAHSEANSAVVKSVAQEAGPTIEWLADCYGFPFSVVHDFDYPGHSARRMHGLPSRSGAELIDRDLASGEKGGFKFVLQQTASGYSVQVTPVAYGTSGTHTFYSDQSMSIHTHAGQEPATATDPLLGENTTTQQQTTPAATGPPATAPAQ